MTSIATNIPSLPYIDATPTTEQVSDAEKLIAAETGPINTVIPESTPSKLLPAMENYVEDRKKTPGIDISRYTNLEDSQGNVNLLNAYTALEYTLGRKDNVALLDEFGRVQWLVGNDELDQIVKAVDRQLAASRTELEQINQNRKRKQVAVSDTLGYLEKRWKSLLGDVVDVGVKNAILEAELEGDEEDDSEDGEEEA